MPQPHKESKPADNPTLATLASRLSTLRGYTPRRAIAESIGVKGATYAAWEYGRNEPGIEDLARLARFFGVSSDYLLGLSDAQSVMVSNNGDNSPVANLNASCADCPLARTIERQASIIEKLSSK